MKSSILVGTSAVVLAFGLSGCFMFGGMARTPMPATEVTALTTCGTGDIAAIKKNLMLAGYSVLAADEETIETDFKQTAGFGGSKEFRKITAVRVDDGTTKFKVRVKSESREQVKTGEMRDSQGRTIATDSQIVNNENEGDEEYYVEAKDVYQQTRNDVCGAGGAATTTT